MSTLCVSTFPSSGKSALILAVEENNLQDATQLIQRGADVNCRVVDKKQLNSAHEVLTSSVTAQNIHDISHISIPYDVTVAIVYAVCLITCDEDIQPEMTYLHVWYEKRRRETQRERRLHTVFVPLLSGLMLCNICDV